MIRYYLLILFVLNTSMFFAQTRTIHFLEQENFNQSNKNSSWIDASEPIKDVFTLAVKSKSVLNLSYRINNNDKISNWKPLEINAHRQPTDQDWVSELYFLPNETNGIQFRSFGNKNLTEPIEVIFFELQKEYASEKSESVDSTICECEQPAFFDRAAWCPTNDCPEISNPAITNVTHLIVHHAASANTSSNWSGVVRAIWDFHVNTNGWDDIGYNWLVDPNGEVYQGRGDNVRGAHFCGTNSGTMGTCMLGNFQTEAPKEEAIEKLTKLLAWKACDVDILPNDSAFHNSSGLMLNRIAGHRQGCSTSCPGDLFFPLFTDLRNAVENYIADSCETIATNIIEELITTKIQLYPNPAVDYINIELDNSDELTYSVLNINGEVLIEEKPLKTRRINLIDFSSGIYFLNIKAGTQSTVKKFSVLRNK